MIYEGYGCGRLRKLNLTDKLFMLVPDFYKAWSVCSNDLFGALAICGRSERLIVVIGSRYVEPG